MTQRKSTGFVVGYITAISDEIKIPQSSSFLCGEVIILICAELFLCQPLVLFSVKSGCLIPGVIFEVSYHPHIAHLITGSNYLMVVVSVSDVGCGALNTFINIVTYEAGTESLRLVELIIVNLGLRMMVGRIA